MKKRARINNKIVALENNVVSVYHKGNVIKSKVCIDNPLLVFEAYCQEIIKAIIDKK